MPPPPKKNSPPPRLPKTERVKVARSSSGYLIVTAGMGLIVGTRLDKGRGLAYPECRTSGLTLDEAKKSLAVWDQFLILQEKKR